MSPEDVYKAIETWEQAQMGVGNESTFYEKKKPHRSSDMGKEIFYRYCSI